MGEWLVFGVLPLLLFCWWLGFAVLDSGGDWAFDFRQAWQGGKDVLDGMSPYPSPELLATAGNHLDPVDIQEVFRFPYPAAAAVGLSPLGTLAFDSAAAIWGILLILSLFAAAWTLGVRDWRVLGVVIGSAPIIGAVRIGTLTPVLLLLLTVAWRWRDRRWIVGLSLAIAISLKLFLWPLVVWLAATRRWAAAVATVGSTAVLLCSAWAVIGFEGLGDYPELLRKLADVVQDRGFSLVALAWKQACPTLSPRGFPGWWACVCSPLSPWWLYVTTATAERSPLLSLPQSRSLRSCGSITSRCSSSRWRSSDRRCPGRGCPCGSSGSRQGRRTTTTSGGSSSPSP